MLFPDVIESHETSNKKLGCLLEVFLLHGGDADNVSHGNIYCCYSSYRRDLYQLSYITRNFINYTSSKYTINVEFLSRCDGLTTFDEALTPLKLEVGSKSEEVW